VVRDFAIVIRVATPRGCSHPAGGAAPYRWRLRLRQITTSESFAVSVDWGAFGHGQWRGDAVRARQQ